MPNMQTEEGRGAVRIGGFCEPQQQFANITYFWGKDDHFQLTMTFEKVSHILRIVKYCINMLYLADYFAIEAKKNIKSVKPKSSKNFLLKNC